MHETEPNNDVTPPCADCGETAIPCACGKPIETVAQLQRALEAAGADMFVTGAGAKVSPRWWVHLRNHTSDVIAQRSGSMGYGDTLSAAIEMALDAWWAR